MLVCIVKDGITVVCDGCIHKFHGTVMVVLADTVAAHQLGGFKVGVGFSLRVCRDCMATKDMIQDKVRLKSPFNPFNIISAYMRKNY